MIQSSPNGPQRLLSTASVRPQSIFGGPTDKNLPIAPPTPPLGVPAVLGLGRAPAAAERMGPRHARPRASCAWLRSRFAPFAPPAYCPASSRGTPRKARKRLNWRVHMCKVLNKRSHADAVYIGRGSKWGNPFRIGIDGDRAAVIVKYEWWLRNQHHLLRALDELRGHDLLCFCAQSLSWRSAAAARQRFARGAHSVVARGCRMIVTGRRQAADRGRDQAQDTSARRSPTSLPVMSHRGRRSSTRNPPAAGFARNTRACLSPPPMAPRISLGAPPNRVERNR